MASEFGNNKSDHGYAGFSARLKMLIGVGSVRGCASQWGVPEGSLRQYLAGSEPGLGKVEAIAKGAGVSIEWLATGRLAVPVMGLAACGLEGGWYEERKLGLTAEAPEGASPRSIAVIACGESMVPADINPGDTVFVDTGADAKPGQIALAELKDGGAAIKRLAAIEGDWAVLEGWLPPEGEGPQQPYVDRLRLDRIHRLMPVIAVRRGLSSLAQAAALAAPRTEAGPEIDKVLDLVPAAVAETMRFIKKAELVPDPEPTGDLCGISMRLMIAPELEGVDAADRQAAIRRHLEAFLPALKRPFWKRLIG